MARINDTDTPRTVPTEDRVGIERCGHHRSQLQDVASARTRVARRRRAACRHGHAPQHHSVSCHQASGARRVCPTHFSGQDLRSGTHQPLPNAAHHVHSESHWTTTTTTLTAFLTWLDTTVMNADGSSTHGSASLTCVPCTSAKSSWPSIG